MNSMFEYELMKINIGLKIIVPELYIFIYKAIFLFFQIKKLQKLPLETHFKIINYTIFSDFSSLLLPSWADLCRGLGVQLSMDTPNPKKKKFII